MATSRFIRWFREVGIADVPLVGGKNASLGEMYRELGKEGIKVPNGFAITAEGYRHFLRASGLEDKLSALVRNIDTGDLTLLADRGRQAHRTHPRGRTSR